jgi:hypothetical protein
LLHLYTHLHYAILPIHPLILLLEGLFGLIDRYLPGISRMPFPYFENISPDFTGTWSSPRKRTAPAPEATLPPPKRKKNAIPCPHSMTIVRLTRQIEAEKSSAQCVWKTTSPHHPTAKKSPQCRWAAHTSSVDIALRHTYLLASSVPCHGAMSTYRYSRKPAYYARSGREITQRRFHWS